MPELKSVATDQLGLGPVTLLNIDRDTASRLGISTQTIDDTLYDAFGQRQVSIIFTQLNLYRVILEVNPELAKGPRALDRIYVRSANRRARCRSRRWCSGWRPPRRSPSTTRGSSPR